MNKKQIIFGFVIIFIFSLMFGIIISTFKEAKSNERKNTENHLYIEKKTFEGKEYIIFENDNGGLFVVPNK